jgi:hypothetical protein
MHTKYENNYGVCVCVYNYVSSSVVCSAPIPPINGAILDYNETVHLPGDYITFNCSEFYTPETPETSICGPRGEWIPPPHEHICTESM